MYLIQNRKFFTFKQRIKKMLTISDLPVGSFPKALDYIHFPTRFQAVIFRNWNTVSFERIAKVLSCTKEDVINALTILFSSTAVNV